MKKLIIALPLLLVSLPSFSASDSGCHMFADIASSAAKVRDSKIPESVALKIAADRVPGELLEVTQQIVSSAYQFKEATPEEMYQMVYDICEKE